MELETTLSNNDPLLLAIGVIGILLAFILAVATVYTAWLLAGLLVVETIERILVMLGIITLAALSAE